MKPLENQVADFLYEVILRSHHHREFLLGECLSDVDLTSTQEHILMLVLSDNKTKSELAKTLHISQAAITKSVKELIRQNLVVIVKDAHDARVTYVELTEKGRPIAKEHQAHHQSTLAGYRSVLDQFTSEEKETIARFLDLLEEKIKE